MTKNRLLDKKRDAALELKIGTPDDPSPIIDYITIDGVLLVIKETGIYEVKLADQIDPGRSNPDVPNINQKILSYGSKSE